jgi:GNAT superfamily N-acetyltransferase
MEANGTVVRVATGDDAPELLKMIGHFLSDTVYGETVDGETDTMAALVNRVASGELGQVLVAEHAGSPVGMVGVLVYDHPLTGKTVGSELIWWVEPSARSTRAGVKLLKASEEWAKERGALSMQFMSWHGRLKEFYERLGYRELETVYEKVF